MRRILKSKIIRILVIAGVAIALCAFFFGRTRPAKIGEIQSFSFSYNRGSTMYSNVNYKLEWKDGVYTATVKPYDEPEETARSFSVEEGFVRELEQLLIDNDVGKWNGFDKTSRTAMDGDGFSLYITMMDETSLDARGYMKWPKNYGTVSSGIETLFGNLMK